MANNILFSEKLLLMCNILTISLWYLYIDSHFINSLQNIFLLLTKKTLINLHNYFQFITKLLLYLKKTCHIAFVIAV